MMCSETLLARFIIVFTASVGWEISKTQAQEKWYIFEMSYKLGVIVNIIYLKLMKILFLALSLAQPPWSLQG